jgi:hypothetical protein
MMVDATTVEKERPTVVALSPVKFAPGRSLVPIRVGFSPGRHSPADDHYPVRASTEGPLPLTAGRSLCQLPLPVFTDAQSRLLPLPLHPPTPLHNSTSVLSPSSPSLVSSSTPLPQAVVLSFSLLHHWAVGDLGGLAGWQDKSRPHSRCGPLCYP